jgi:hypothetical protein
MSAGPPALHDTQTGKHAVIDLLMLILLAASFFAAVGYVHVCARLTRSANGSQDKPP